MGVGVGRRKGGGKKRSGGGGGKGWKVFWASVYCLHSIMILVHILSLSFVLFNDTWSQRGHSVPCMTIPSRVCVNHKIRPGLKQNGQFPTFSYSTFAGRGLYQLLSMVSADGTRTCIQLHVSILHNKPRFECDLAPKRDIRTDTVYWPRK